MRSKTISLLCTLVLVSMCLPSQAARQTREEMERSFLYGWSSSATLIFYGTVAAVEYIDDPRLRTPHVEVVVRVDSLQRGVPGDSMVRVRIEDELQTYRWRDNVSRIGEVGMWFLHRVRQYESASPRGYLIRHIDQIEMEEDPQFLSELMKYVIQDTVDQTIKPNILNIMTGKKGDRESAKMVLDLTYNELGALDDLVIVERSDNLLFNDHVFDSVLQVHRRIRIPGSVKSTRIEIKREVL